MERNPFDLPLDDEEELEEQANVLTHEEEDEDDPLATERIDVDQPMVSIGKASLIGMRKEQQDAIRTDDFDAYSEEGRAIAVLCDGMGGLSGGELASNKCASLVFNAFHEMPSGASIPRFFRAMIAQADREVGAIRGSDGAALRCGTTLVSAVIENGGLYWASVGDSRIYLIRGEEIVCLTKDHNLMMLLNEQVKRGEITREEANSNPKREALISFIGGGVVRCVDCPVKPIPLRDGDHVVLCSDGLYRSVSEEEIWQIVTAFQDTAAVAAQMLAEQAVNKRFPHQDNTSVIVMTYYAPGNHDT